MTDIVVTAAKVAGQPRTLSFPAMAAVTITAGQALYMLTDGTVGLCDTNDSGKEQFCGIALNAASAGYPVEVAYQGPVEGFTLSGNAWALLYGSNTAGAIADSAGTMTVNVGRILTKTDGTKYLWVHVNLGAAAWA